MQRTSLIAIAMSFALGGWAAAAPEPLAHPVDVLAPFAGPDWIVQTDDNVCGITDPKKISNPAKVNYEELLDATSQIQEMKRDKVDPDSPRGKQLRHDAQVAITKAANLVRKSKGLCGVWKEIRHKDGRTVPDITAEIKAKL